MLISWNNYIFAPFFVLQGGNGQGNTSSLMYSQVFLRSIITSNCIAANKIPNISFSVAGNGVARNSIAG